MSTDKKLADAPMFGNIIAADFDNDTLTLKMEPGYYAAAGRFQLQRVALAELAARRARDAEVEALVKAAKDAARDIHLVLSIDGQELELGSLRKLSSAERNLRTTLSAFTGAKP